MHVSIVTPALDEALAIPARARELAREAPPFEWIVVDGGSVDGTADAARAGGATVVAAPRGRGMQLNAGAKAARGDVLLFLHADTALPRGAIDAVRAACRDAAVVGGNFRFRFDDRSIAGAFLSHVYAAKQRLFRVWYGDSALFVRRDVFEELGGFEPYPIMEDVHFVERLRRRGRTVRLPLTVTSSARRYRGRVVRTIAQWSLVFALYKIGVSPHRLARLYRPHGAPRR